MADEPMFDSAVGELAHIRGILESILVGWRVDVLQVVVGAFQRQETVLEDSPVPGSRAKRLLIPRPGQGNDALACAAGVVTSVLHVNEGAVGRYIRNRGPSECVLYLAHAGELGGEGAVPSGQAQNRPAIDLPANGSWDGLLGHVLYGGPVCAIAQAGAASLTVAEF